VRALNESDITKEINVKKIDDLISLAKDRVNFQMEILNECKKIICYDKKEIRSNSKEIKLTENILGIIEDFIKKLEQIDNVNPNKLKEIYFDMLKNNDVKIGQGMKSLRVLLTGKTSGPDLFTLTEILGKDKIVLRLKKSMNIIND
jgi:glutamyl/glutaminyl-tRNA synthetase